MDAVQATAVPAPGAEATPVPLSVPKATGPRDWTMEYVAGAVVVAYIVCYIVGRAANSKIVSTIGRALRPVMRANFASLEQSGESGTSLNMEAVSGSEFEYWASGRQHCAGLLLTLTLRARQDLFSTISNLVLPTVLPQAAPVQLDTCTIEVPLSASAQGVVFALASAKKLKELQEAEADLKNFGSKTLAGGEYGAPADYTVLTETRELATLICNKEMAAALAELKSRLVSLRVTDVADLVSLYVTPLARARTHARTHPLPMCPVMCMCVCVHACTAYAGVGSMVQADERHEHQGAAADIQPAH
ncbi:MAG: DUF1682 domain-containing protein [Methanobacteriota archaeon]|nr:MAG: DUF1682 domain-containing protein [Euryarchaeota archaeon]